MKTSLLQLVQETLRGMNSDTVASISDTEESRQLALIAKEVYEYLEVYREWPHKQRPFVLDSSDISGNPAELNVPAGVSQITDLRYKTPVDADDLSQGYCNKLLTFLQPVEFVEKFNCYDGTETNVETFNLYSTDLANLTDAEDWPNEQWEIGIRNDKDPEYWTTFDDFRVLFDSYDSVRQASGLVRWHARATGYIMYTFDNTDDDYIIKVPDRDWVLYKSLIKAKAWEDIKQLSNANANQIARKLLIRAQKTRNHITDRTRPGVNYGRK